MIWIEGTFYVDGTQDLSRPTREWIARQRERLAWDGAPMEEDTPVEMDSVRFADLRIRLGAQYLFMHEGGCQHALVFEECALLSPRDEMRVEMCAAPGTFPVMRAHHNASYATALTR
jgi:hypothetical protein